MAPAPAVDNWGADGLFTKLPPAGVLTGIKILPYKEANGPEKSILPKRKTENMQPKGGMCT